MDPRRQAKVVGVASDGEHRFSKVPQEQVVLVEGHGVEGDAHAGSTVQHRSRVAGVVRVGDPVAVVAPPEPRHRLARV